MRLFSWPTLFVVAAIAVANGSESAPAVTSELTKTFQVGNRSFKGTDKTICVLEGAWADGQALRYEAWDRCDKITLEWVPARSTPHTVKQVAGRNRTHVIPAGSESFIVANDHSRIWLFREKDGDIQVILIAD